MKRILFCSAFLALTSTGAMAQDAYDLARLSGSDLNGTARFVGMGGAMSALGADMTTMGTNPAGIGVYKSNDLAVSAGAVLSNNPGQLKDGRASFDQLGMVFSTKYSNYSSLRYVNFGINYRKRANLFDTYGVSNNWNGMFSQTYQMADMTYNESSTANMPALASIAAQSGAINYTGDDASTTYSGIGANDTYFNTIQTGGIHEIDFSVAGNWNDRVFAGLTLGCYDVSLDRSSYYTETGTDGAYYDLWNSYRTRGTGIDLKLGMIFRPIEDSGFRFGLAVHTPTFYDLEDSNSATINVYNSNDQQIGSNYVDVDPVGYQFISPWKFNFSLGHTIGNNLAIGAEYELATYGSIRLRNDDGSQSAYTDYVDDYCSDLLKATHTLRLGLEFKPIPELSLRLGYNYVSAAFDKAAYRSLQDFTDMYVDTFTDTSYENTYALNRFTAGVGFRIDRLYLDMAYQYTTQNSDFYAFDDYYVDSNNTKQYLPATELTKNRHQLTFTVGYRF